MDNIINYSKVNTHDCCADESLEAKQLRDTDPQPNSASIKSKHQKEVSPESSRSGISDRLSTHYTKVLRCTELSAWLWEACYLIAATICLIAILWLAIDTDGKRQDQWRLQISLNSLVAILSTIFRSTLDEITGQMISQLKWWWYRQPRPLLHLQHFDDASRGPYGAFLLLYRLGKVSFVQLGCIITLISYAIGPFIQQAIGSQLCTYDRPDMTAIIPLAKGDRPGWSSVHRWSSGQYVLNAITQASIVAAIADPSSNRPSLLSGCKTGNCSFDQSNGISYTTMGLCSVCEDTSASIHEVIGNRSSRLTLPNGLFLSNFSGAMKFSTSSNQFDNLNLSSGFIHAAEVALVNISMLALTSAPCSYVGGASFGKWTCNPQVQAASDSGWNGIDVVSAACSIHACMKSYSTSVSNAIARETLIKTKPAVHGRTVSGRFDAIGLDGDCKLALGQDLANIANVSTSNDRSNSTGFIDAQEVIIPRSCLDMITFPYIDGIIPLLSNIFAGSCLFSEVSPSSLKSPTERQEVFCGNQTITSEVGGGSWWLEGLNNRGNATLDSISSHMQHIADVMTDRLRLDSFNASNPRSFAQGTVMQTTVCTKLDWQWLMLPCGMLALVFIFVAITVGRSSLQRGEVPLWKSSMLPLWYMKRDELQSGWSDTVSGMKDASQSTNIRLARDDSSRPWYLSKI